MPQAVGITAYEHVDIRVCDKDEAITFCRKLGFELSEDFSEHHALEMENSAGVRINLIDNGTSRANILMDEAVRHPGVTHPAFTVSSLDAVVESLEAGAIPITEGPVEIGDRRRICFIRDPDGNVIEFDELR